MRSKDCNGLLRCGATKYLLLENLNSEKNTLKWPLLVSFGCIRKIMMEI